MKTIRSSITRFLTSYMTTLGGLHLLYCICAFREYSSGMPQQATADMLVAALLLAACHFIITEEALDRKVPVKARMLGCILPCAAAMAIVVYWLDIPNWFRLSGDNVTASIVWYAAFIIATLLLILIFFLITQKYNRTARVYNAALAKYKQNNTGN